MIQKNEISYAKLFSIERLFSAWNIFKDGKSKRKDVLIFENKLEENIFDLYNDLTNLTYQHSEYTSFHIYDPKLRHIHKACIRDRLVHQILYSYLCGIYERKFIFHSYSSRLGKGTHRAVANLSKAAGKVSKNYYKNCFALKCDVKRFYDTVCHEILLKLILKELRDKKIIAIIKDIISSYNTKNIPNKGMPIGNLTSQVFSNIYLNELDQFIKHELKVPYYFRYADDFILLSQDCEFLQNITIKIEQFISRQLAISLHPKKVIIRRLSQGIDFLGYIVLPYYKNIRTKTKRRMWKKLYQAQCLLHDSKLSKESLTQVLNSYAAMLSHADAYDLNNNIRNIFGSDCS